MPSFLSDEPENVSFSNTQSAEPFGEGRQSSDKANGNTKLPLRQSTTGSIDDGAVKPLDGPVNGSPINGDMARDHSLDSIPNGRSSIGSWEKKVHQNGHQVRANGGTNGVSENGGSSTETSNGTTTTAWNSEATTYISPNGVSAQDHEPTTKSTANGEIETSKKSAPPQPITTSSQIAPTYNSTLHPATPIPPETPKRNLNGSPHRFSSPPSYAPKHPPTSPSLLSAETPQQASQPPPLKHRHTLQVPKVGHTRGSTDGDPYASGRFSPTARRGSLNLVRRNTRSIHSDMPHEEVIPDEDAARWAEAVRQKRASKRKRKEEEDDDRVVVGTKVDQNHVNWVTAYNMLTGIRFTVSRTNAKLDRPLTDTDFEAKHKFSFDITGNELTPSAKYDFKFKDYAPWVFRHLRAKFKIDPADYLMSLTSKYILSELGSPGKSGSFFYFSRDYRYIIKTIHHAEHKLLRKILKDYYNHVEENPNTLLSQFYGLHRVKIPYGRKIHFVVMNNLFPPHRDIHQTFDLKGSTVGRDFREQDLLRNPRATLKDLNWLRRNLHLEFGPEKKAIFLKQMEKDVRLLQKLKIMDYSMLVGIHDMNKGNQENLRDKTLKVFSPGGETPPEEAISGGTTMLMRTPSKLETARKARELREIIKQEKPIPMGQMTGGMPDQLTENIQKKDFIFYSNDGGFQATHEDNRPGEEIYYLGIIDLLTHYGTIKRLENFWKGLSHDKSSISPVPPHPYGDRFIKFISGVTKSREEAEKEEESVQNVRSSESVRSPRGIHMRRTSTTNSVLREAEDEAIKSEKRGASEDSIPDRTLTTVRSPSAERTADRAGMTLPIVDEVGESSSTGGRSGRSNIDPDERDERPPTPPKDNPPLEQDGSPKVPPKDVKGKGKLKRDNSFDSNKALPPIPKVDSPEPMNEKESIVS